MSENISNTKISNTIINEIIKRDDAFKPIKKNIELFKQYLVLKKDTKYDYFIEQIKTYVDKLEKEIKANENGVDETEANKTKSKDQIDNYKKIILLNMLMQMIFNFDFQHFNSYLDSNFFPSSLDEILNLLTGVKSFKEMLDQILATLKEKELSTTLESKIENFIELSAANNEEKDLELIKEMYEYNLELCTFRIELFEEEAQQNLQIAQINVSSEEAKNKEELKKFYKLENENNTLQIEHYSEALKQIKNPKKLDESKTQTIDYDFDLNSEYLKKKAIAAKKEKAKEKAKKLLKTFTSSLKIKKESLAKKIETQPEDLNNKEQKSEKKEEYKKFTTDEWEKFIEEDAKLIGNKKGNLCDLEGNDTRPLTAENTEQQLAKDQNSPKDLGEDLRSSIPEVLDAMDFKINGKVVPFLTFFLSILEQEEPARKEIIQKLQEKFKIIIEQSKENTVLTEDLNQLSGLMGQISILDDKEIGEIISGGVVSEKIETKLLEEESKSLDNALELVEEKTMVKQDIHAL